MKRNERTSARVAKIAGRILASTRKYGVWAGGPDATNSDFIEWKDIRALAASALTQTKDKEEHAIIRKGKLPQGHKLIKRHKPVFRNGKVREAAAARRKGA